MALVTKNFTLNVTPGAMPPTVHVSEYDIGRTYAVQLLDENGSAYEIPTGTTATVEGTLNGTVGFTTSATIDGNQISFALAESMTAYAGKAWCKIKLTLNDEPIQTCAFILAVDRAGVEAETVIGASGFEQQIADAVDAWLEENAQNGIPTAVKTALLNCFENVAWIDEDGQDYYDALHDALNPQVLDYITAVFTQGTAKVYDVDSLDSLKQYLVVTAHYTNGTSEVLADSAYTLSGTLAVGTSTITATYENETATFTVTVSSHYLYKLENYAFNNEYIDTEVQLLDEDKDFTIALDVNITSEPTSGNGSQVRYMAMYNAAGDGYAISYGKGNATANAYAIVWMGNNTSTVNSGTGRLRVVYTHLKNSGSATVKARKGTGTASSYTVNGTFAAATSRNLMFGRNADAGKLPAGTINKAYVLDYVMTSAEIDAFLGL